MTNNSPARRWALAIVAVLAMVAPCAADERRVLLLHQGPDGHPPQTHEYRVGARVLAECLERIQSVEVEQVNADEPWDDGPELLKSADCAVLYLAEGAKWASADPRRRDAFARLASRGGGLVCLHWGMGTRTAEPIEPFVALFGGCHGGPDRKYAVVETQLSVASPDHPITRGVSDLTARDEFYYRLKFAKPADAVTPILRAVIDSQPETVAWAFERPDGGRSFGFSGLHFHDNWRREEYRRVVAQGVLWTVNKLVPNDGLDVSVDAATLEIAPR